MYFALKSLKIYLHYSALHVSDTIVSHHQELLSCTCSLWSLSIIRIHVVYNYVIMYIL